MELQSKQHRKSSQVKVSAFRKHSDVQLPRIHECSKTPLESKSRREGRSTNAGREQSAATRSNLGIGALASGGWNIMSNTLFAGTDQQ